MFQNKMPRRRRKLHFGNERIHAPAVLCLYLHASQKFEFWSEMDFMRPRSARRCTCTSFMSPSACSINIAHLGSYNMAADSGREVRGGRAAPHRVASFEPDTAAATRMQWKKFAHFSIKRQISKSHMYRNLQIEAFQRQTKH